MSNLSQDPFAICSEIGFILETLVKRVNHYTKLINLEMKLGLTFERVSIQRVSGEMFDCCQIKCGLLFNVSPSKDIV